MTLLKFQEFEIHPINGRKEIDFKRAPFRWAIFGVDREDRLTIISQHLTPNEASRAKLNLLRSKERTTRYIMHAIDLGLVAITAAIALAVWGMR